MAAAGTSAADGRRFALVDALRALAAISVLGYHVSFLYPVPAGAWAHVSQRLAAPPIPGVVLFFVVSGFLLYRPFALARLSGAPAPGLRAYALRRVARIVPGYWVALALVTVWLGLDEVESAKGVIRYFGFLQLYGPPEVLQGGLIVAWTLCVEVTFYAALPMLAWALRRLSPRGGLRSELVFCAALAAGAVLWQVGVLLFAPPSWHAALMWALPGSLVSFAAGMALAGVVASHEASRRTPEWVSRLDRAPWAPWALALGLLFVADLLPLSPDSQGWWVPGQLLKSIAAALLVVPAVLGDPHRGLLRRVLGLRPVLWLGTVSYGIYLWHVPIARKVAAGHADGWPEWFAMSLVLLTTLAFAAASFYLVERPAQRLVRRRLRAGTVDPALADRVAEAPA